MTAPSPALRSLGNLAFALLALFAVLHVADRIAFGLAVRAAAEQPSTPLLAPPMKGTRHEI